MAADGDRLGRWLDDQAPPCTGCGRPIVGALWSGGHCLPCHEASLQPPDADEIAGLADARTGRDTTDWEIGS